MYQVLLGDLNGNNSILYYPADLDCVIYDTNLKMAVGAAGTFEFKIPTTNPLYGEIKQGSIVTILRDDVEMWRGEICETSKDFNGNMSVYCVEDLAWLGVEFMQPTQILTESYAQRFQSALNAYNQNQVGTERRFEIGYITNVNNAETCNWSTQYEWSILDSIRECIAKDTGYVRVRRQNGKRYIDIVRLADYGIQATQPVRFAQNLLDYVEEMNMNNFTNVIYPYGKETDTQIYEGTNQRLVGTVIADENSIAKYGRHARTVCFETDDLTTLNSLAQAYITRYSQPQLIFELNAIDLADIESEAHFDLGDSIRVIAEPFGIDQWIYLTEQTIDLQDVSKSTFTLSSYITTGRTLTEQTLGTAEAVEDIPSKASFLDAAKKNALELLEGVDGGYVSFNTNADGQIVELIIANNLDKSQATKMWQWTLGGLGFKEKDAAGNWQIKDAMTMDGSIVAERITSGVLTGQTIRGAKIETVDLDGNQGYINSVSNAGGSTRISGGSILINNTADAYLQIQAKNNARHYVTFGADRWTVAREDEGKYKQFDPWELVKNMPDA